MKRYNIFLPDDWPEKIKLISNEIQRITNQGYFYSLTTADIIRIATALTLGLEIPKSHYGTDRAIEALPKIIKRLKKEGKL